MEKYPWKFELPIKLDNGKKIKLIWLEYHFIPQPKN